MTMSKDRVRFKLTIESSDSPAMKAAIKAFNVTPSELRKRQNFADGCSHPKVEIICRPSQFARFLIYRNDYEGRNGFKELEPRLVADEATPFDVSAQPRSYP